MENIDFDSNNTSDDDLNTETKNIDPQQLLPVNSGLLDLIPPAVISICNLHQSNEGLLHEAISNLYVVSRTEDLHSFFRQLGADITIWMSKQTVREKADYVFDALNENVRQSLKRVNSDADNLLKNLNIKRKGQNIKTEVTRSQNFDWFNLKTSNQMLKSKLKTKLVQTINQFKNEKKLRAVMNTKLSQDQKIHLQDESFDISDSEKQKVNYQWTQQDEKIFINNISKLKEKFTKTEFLKNCHRYKFITNSQLCTLAAEDISRKLDKSNKAFLSRDFLLDKYFSTKENLTEKQMKFILKTSPLLSKCVDKAFVRAAIKNIQYQDIDKMELQIAEQIITKFETIRNLVRNSRKAYKQQKNNLTKKKIVKFEQKQRYNEKRNIQRQNLIKHKTKMLRNLNYKSTAQLNKQNRDSYIKVSKQNNDKKMVWPLPLNNSHPSTGIFIRDCNEQCNQDLNQYEKSYYNKFHQSGIEKNPILRKNNSQGKSMMVNFYTGGPLQNYKTSFGVSINQNQGKQNKEALNKILKIICNTFKTAFYKKQITQRVDTYEHQEAIQSLICHIIPKAAKTCKSITDVSYNDSNRTKKVAESSYEDVITSGTSANVPISEQAEVKRKILDRKQKAKMAVYLKKLLSLAAQNSFLSLKALNISFTPSQINTVDRKGNTALFYATRNRNKQFVDYLIGNKANCNIKGEKGLTPLHNAFKSSDYILICKCLIGSIPPDLNVLDDFGKTPIAYCGRKVLERLGLQNGVVSVPLCSLNRPPNFDNNILLCKDKIEGSKDDELEMKTELRRRKSRISGRVSNQMTLQP